jgi:hypothetical protein
VITVSLDAIFVLLIVGVGAPFAELRGPHKLPILLQGVGWC